MKKIGLALLSMIASSLSASDNHLKGLSVFGDSIADTFTWDWQKVKKKRQENLTSWYARKGLKYYGNGVWALNDKNGERKLNNLGI